MQRVKRYRRQPPEVQEALMINEIVPVYVREPKRTKDLPFVHTTSSVVGILKAHYDNLLVDTIEYFSVIYLNRGNKACYFYKVSEGGISGTVADPRIVLRIAILVGATSMILCHNHPSGNLRPSMADRELTIKIKQAAKYHDINVLDHIIISQEGYYSFADEGII